MDYVWVNTNGFALGEQAKTYWGIRIFQMSVRAGVKHLVYSGLDSVYKKSGYGPKFRVGHYEGKARVEEWIAAQPTSPMAWTCIDSGPYMEGLTDMFLPKPDSHGVYNISLPLGSGVTPQIHLHDLARYVHWAYQNASQSTGLRLGIATAHVSGQDMASAFTAVTGKPAKYQDIPIEMWLQKAFSQYPHGVESKVGYRTAHDTALTQTYRENLTNWFELDKASAENRGLLTKDYTLLDSILPDRVKSLEEWMRRVGYTGDFRPVLKDHAEERAKSASV